VADVFPVIDLVYKTRLITPNAQSTVAKLWADKEKQYAASNAELTIQMYLETALWVAFPHCKVVPEYAQVSGRFDLAVVGRDETYPGRFIHHAVLELKVLRAFGVRGGRTTPAKVKQWISEGLDQAFSYAEEFNAKEAALCCFDMRHDFTGDACFLHVKDRAAALGISVRVWHLFSSLVKYRAYRASLTVGQRSSFNPGRGRS
jgi:hypothetical protein